jgi:predicted GNAT family acetyltransferase
MAHQFTHAADRRRYELHDEASGELLGYIDYRPAGDSTIIAHTEVPVEQEGKGIGGELVRGAFAAIEADGKTVIPICPFAAAYVQRHPELVPLVAPGMRGQFAGG